MTRRFGTFAAALITIVTSLVAFTWAQAPAAGFEQFWSARYTSPSSSVAPSSAAPAGGVAPAGDVAALAARRPIRRRPRRVQRDAPLEPDRHRRQRARPHPGGGRRDRALRRAARTRPLQPRHGYRPHRDLRRRQRDRRRYQSYTGLPELAETLDGCGDRAGGARYARRAVPVAAHSSRCSPRTSPRFRDRREERTASASASAPPRHPRAARQRRFAARRAAHRRRLHSRAIGPGKWRQDPISLSRLRSARTGERSRRSSCGVGRNSASPPPPAMTAPSTRPRTTK